MGAGFIAAVCLSILAICCGWMSFCPGASKDEIKRWLVFAVIFGIAPFAMAIKLMFCGDGP